MKPIKTTIKLCKQCKYSYSPTTDTVFCCYITYTNKRRGCQLGECDKFEPGTNPKKHIKFGGFINGKRFIT